MQKNASSKQPLSQETRYFWHGFARVEEICGGSEGEVVKYEVLLLILPFFACFCISVVLQVKWLAVLIMHCAMSFEHFSCWLQVTKASWWRQQLHIGHAAVGQNGWLWHRSAQWWAPQLQKPTDGLLFFQSWSLGFWPQVVILNNFKYLHPHPSWVVHQKVPLQAPRTPEVSQNWSKRTYSGKTYELYLDISQCFLEIFPSPLHWGLRDQAQQVGRVALWAEELKVFRNPVIGQTLEPSKRTIFMVNFGGYSDIIWYPIGLWVTDVDPNSGET